MVAATQLRMAGYQVDETEDGNAGWQAFSTRSYDVVVTDNNMPFLTGLELIVRIRAASSQIPVLLASGMIEKEDLAPDVAGLINEFLPKPYSSLHLLQSVARLLESRGCIRPLTIQPNSSNEAPRQSSSSLCV